MSKRPEIELSQDEYQPVFTRPLASPRMLWTCAVGFLLFTIGGAWAATQLDTWWAGLLPVPAAFCLGGVMSGLFPRYFFGKDRT
jgi:hypothetical protein